MKRRTPIAVEVALILLAITTAGLAAGTLAYWLPRTLLGWTP